MFLPESTRVQALLERLPPEDSAAAFEQVRIEIMNAQQGTSTHSMATLQELASMALCRAMVPYLATEELKQEWRQVFGAEFNRSSCSYFIPNPFGG